MGRDAVPLFPRWPVLLLGLCVLQLPLVLNPGWFSHDELQWAARADVAHFADLPWLAWSDWHAFQYRPLTFNLWLVLAHALDGHPFIFHGAVVALGSLNALLLARILVAAGASRRVAAAAAAAFIVSPYVAYVHGWVGTLGDLLVLLFTLVAFRFMQHAADARAAGLAAIGVGLLGLTAAALLAKEAAVVLPAALLLALYRHPRPGVASALVALACVPVAAYLALRLPYLLAPPAGGETYATSLAHVPARLAEYVLFPFIPNQHEVGPTLTRSPPRLFVAGACLLTLLAALSRRGRAWPLAWLAAVSVLLAPVLVLHASANQYAYLASAAAVGIVAAAWPGLAPRARGVLACIALVVSAHGVGVMLAMRHVGVVQSHFDASYEALATDPPPPCIAPAHESDRWMLLRFTHQVPRYPGACVAPPGQGASLTMRRDGRLLGTPAR
jgi:hypothetical protein